MKKFSIISLALVLAVLVGVAVPQLTYAAPPMQTPVTDPNLISDAFGKLVGLLIALAMGGGVSVLLDMFPAWKNWQSPLKGYLVMGLAVLIGAALTAAQVAVTPQVLAGLPDWALAGISFAVVSLIALLGTQLTYRLTWKQS